MDANVLSVMGVLKLLYIFVVLCWKFERCTLKRVVALNMLRCMTHIIWAWTKLEGYFAQAQANHCSDLK